jgi:hypothetical protein
MFKVYNLQVLPIHLTLGDLHPALCSAATLPRLPLESRLEGGK